MPTTSHTTTADLARRYIRSVSVAETSGSAGVRIQIKDTDTSGDTLIALAAVAGGSAVFTPAHPIRFPSGTARLEFVTGAARVVVDGY